MQQHDKKAEDGEIFYLFFSNHHKYSTESVDETAIFFQMGVFFSSSVKTDSFNSKQLLIVFKDFSVSPFWFLLTKDTRNWAFKWCNGKALARWSGNHGSNPEYDAESQRQELWRICVLAILHVNHSQL